VTDLTKIPGLPDQYVDRVAERQAIEALLRTRGIRVAIYGLPGMGKTAMAAKIASGARGALGADKVLWADLGQAADPVALLRDWCQELDAEVSAVTGPPEEQLAYLRDRLSQAVSDKYVLFVLDDVGASGGDVEAAAACLIDNENCGYLLTAISPQTAHVFRTEHDFRIVHVDVLPDPAAGEVLERYAEGMVSLAALSRADRERLLRLGNGLPLGLMVLGRFLGHGLVEGDRLQSLLGKLDGAEALVEQSEFGARLRAERGRDSIHTILMARWIELPAEQQEALQTAAVFREKPHEFEEDAWAGVVAARRAAPEGAEDLAQELGAMLVKAESDAESNDEEADLDDEAEELPDPDTADDDDLAPATEARERLEPLRKALVKTGLLEQPTIGEPAFTLHSLIAAFLRSTPGLGASEPGRPSELERLHGLAARYYRGWLAGYQEDHAGTSPFLGAYRLENQRWQSAMLDLCYHLRDAGNEDEAVLTLTTLFFDEFWWWGELVPYPLCDELLRMWELAHLGREATTTLRELRRFKNAYPVISLDLVPPDEPLVLPAGYQDDTEAGNFRKVRDAVQRIRARVLDVSGVDDTANERDRVRLRMLTAIYLGEANRVIHDFEQGIQAYDEALELLSQLGQEKEDDDWIIPYIYAELANLHVRAGDFAKALDACDKGARAEVGDGEVLPEDLDDDDVDHEALGWLWLAAGDAHWGAKRLAQAWRSYAWACFHTCTVQLWPEREVRYKHPGAVPESHKEAGVDDYVAALYKVHLGKMLGRIGEKWAAEHRAEAIEGVRVIRQTLAGGPEKSSADLAGQGLLAEVAATRPDAVWADCRDRAWQDTGLFGFAVPLIPWERLVDDKGVFDRSRVEDQRTAAQDLAVRLKDIWASSKWALGEGPGHEGPPLDAEGAAEPDVTGVAE
jgi:NB-ARC domain